MLRSACTEAVTWPPLPDGTTPHVAVNLSLTTLDDSGLFEAVRATLVETGLAPDRLHLEVVETRALRDLPRVIEVLSALRHLGVRVSLDDFGTGYSTLSWLHELPVDRIKVDRAFTAGTTQAHDERRQRTANAVLRGVVGVGRELEVEVLAEGVETADQLAAVHAAGCLLVQGYLLGRPGPPEVLRALLSAPQG